MKKMKKIIYFLTIMLTIIGCDSKPHVVSIPSELEKNEQVVVYFETLNEVINEYVGMVEDLAEASKKNEGEADFASAMKAMSSVANLTMKMAPLLEKIEQLETKGEIMKETLTEQEIQAFADTYAKMLTRIQEASLKINE
jgi:tetrahydromethanopterin S-methyltransferase subunit B